MTLERFFKIAHQKGIIDFNLRADVYTGIVSFYIHPDSKDGDTRDYYVFGNELIPKEEFDKRKAECGEKLIKRFLEIKERKNNTTGNAESSSRPLEPLVRQLPLPEIKRLCDIILNNITNVGKEAEGLALLIAHDESLRQSA